VGKVGVCFVPKNTNRVRSEVIDFTRKEHGCV